MDMRRDIPEPWASALVEAGMVDPRGKGDRPSWSALSRAAEVHTSTLSAMATGARETQQDIVDRVAAALHMDPRTVAEWVGRARTEREPYEAPAEASLLDAEERAAVTNLIRLLARNKKDRSAAGQEPAGQEPAGEEPATDDQPAGEDPAGAAGGQAAGNVTQLAATHDLGKDHPAWQPGYRPRAARRGTKRAVDQDQDLDENQDQGGSDDPA